MAHRHPARHAPLPTLWLMTDERQREALWPALAALPRGSGVVFRHHRTAEPERNVAWARVKRIAAQRKLVLGRETISGGEARILLPSLPGCRPQWIARAGTNQAAAAARRHGATAILVSPVYATRTHPGRPPLGPYRAAAIVRTTRLPAIALGGMTASRFARLKGTGFYGWAAIDGLTPRGQKRKAVPI